MYNNYNIQEELKPEEILMYLRKSRADDPLLSVEEVLSNHESILDEWGERNLPYPIPQENRIKEVVSGESISDRYGFQRVLKMVESDNIKAVMVKELSRLGRPDKQEIGYISKIFRYTKIKVITPTRIFNIADEFERKMFEQELEQGHFYLEYSKNIMSVGRGVSVSRGNFIGSIPPYGYNKVWVMDGKKRCPTLEINDEQADVVRMIFDLYVNKDMGHNRICNYLDDMKIAPPKGKHWSPPAVRDMLANIHYIGKVKWNWRKTVTAVKDGEIVKTRPKTPMGEYLMYDGKHEAIISEELFYAAQDKIGKNHRAKPTTKVRNPLASVLYCSCGRAMSLRIYKNKDGGERCSPRLLCDGQVHCNTGSCLYEEMMERVCEILANSIGDFEIHIKDQTEDTVKLHAKLIRNLEKKLKDIEDKELAQWESQSNPNPELRMPPDIFKKLNEKLLKEKEDTKQALHNAYESMPTPIDYEEKITRFKTALEALRNPDVDAEEKNRLLKLCIDRITYTREKPQRLTREPDEKKGTRFKKSVSYWSNPPIKLDVKLNV